MRIWSNDSLTTQYTLLTLRQTLLSRTLALGRTLPSDSPFYDITADVG